MAEKMDIELKKVKTPEFRVSFPVLFTPKSFKGAEAKFSLVMLFDKKKTDIKPLQKAAFNAAVEKWGPKEKWPKGLKMPFRDGDEKGHMMGYPGCTFVSATSKQRPGVIDQKLQPIVESDQTFYPGCYARATLIAFAYDQAGNRGVSFSLQNVQKLRDGEQFSGRRAAADEFDAVDSDDSSDDPSSYETDEF